MKVHSSWQEILNKSIKALDREYLEFLHADRGYFPDFKNFLNAFKTLPKDKTKTILFGQDPYPREKSAIGYAFIDGAVEEIFSERGFSKEVNCATSLRNFIKMQLCAENYLHEDVSQQAIAKLPKKHLIHSIHELKNNFEKEGILLLNRALIFTCKKDSSLHVRKFRPFIEKFLYEIAHENYTLILFGKEAKSIETLLPKKHTFKCLKMPHPYNISFINDKTVRKYFSSLKLVTIS